MKRIISRRDGIGLFITLTCTVSAFADFTPIIPRAVEPTHHQIIEHLYNRPFQPQGVSFITNDVSATRLDDSAPNPALMGNEFVAKAVAKFSDYTQSFGLIENGAYTKRFDVTGSLYSVSGQGTVKVEAGQGFGRSGETGTHSNLPSESPDNRNHTITYEVSGADPDPQYLLFWEDLTKTPELPEGRTSSDFNDLVVKLEPIPIPLPAAWAPGAALGAMLLVARVRNRYRRASAGRSW